MSLAEEIVKAQTLVEALPYIKRFSQKIVVVKYGGSLLSSPKQLVSLADDIALLRYVGIRPVVVHGGGQEINKWLDRIGKKPRMVEGQPFTDAETLQMIDMVLSGNISNAIVTSLGRVGVRAVGLSGRDANLFTTRRIKTPKQKDLGYVGEIESTDVTLPSSLVDQGYVPVISSVGVSRDGSVLNVDSDLVASSMAAALRASKLIYLASSSGISKGKRLIEFLDLSEAEDLLNSAELSSSLQIKLSAAVAAIKGGVTDVHIISGTVERSLLLEIFTDKGIGTMVTNRKMKI
ncbi:MAG: acetylglutamate kinase [Deltaproteobacteria bacterium]|nr:acetylglutamate kinase [Deltaproteobacteria bacterium]